MMINRLYITRLAAALLLLGGCAKEPQPIEPPQPQPMRFAAFLQEGDNVRPLNSTSNAASRTIDGTLDNGFHLYVSQFNTYNSYICDNLKVATDGTLTTPRFWLQNVANYRIEAYATPGGVQITREVLNPVGVYIPYIAKNDPALQEDLLTASISNLAVTYDKPLVNLYFRHALSRLVFKLQRTMASPSIYDVNFKVTYGFEKVYLDKVIFLDSKNATQDQLLSSYHSGTFPLGKTFNHSASETQPVTIGDMIIVPQTVPQGGLILEMSYKLDPAASAPVQTLTANMNGFTVAREQQMDINIGYSVEVDQLVIQGVSLTDWTTTSGRLDIYK